MFDRFNALGRPLVARTQDLKNEDGQTFVEYALVLSVIVVGVLLAATWTGLGTAIGTAIGKVTDRCQRLGSSATSNSKSEPPPVSAEAPTDDLQTEDSNTQDFQSSRRRRSVVRRVRHRPAGPRAPGLRDPAVRPRLPQLPRDHRRSAGRRARGRGQADDRPLRRRKDRDSRTPFRRVSGRRSRVGSPASPARTWRPGRASRSITRTRSAFPGSAPRAISLRARRSGWNEGAPDFAAARFRPGVGVRRRHPHRAGRHGRARRRRAAPGIRRTASSRPRQTPPRWPARSISRRTGPRRSPSRWTTRSATTPACLVPRRRFPTAGRSTSPRRRRRRDSSPASSARSSTPST